MKRLLVKKLHPNAKLPTVANPGEDLGYDLYALEDAFLEPNKPVIVKTGIAVTFVDTYGPIRDGHGDMVSYNTTQYGLLIRDRSSLGSKGVHTLAGVIDAGYRGEIGVVMVLLGPPLHRSKEMQQKIARQANYRDLSESELAAALAKLDVNNIDYFRTAFGAYPGAEGLGYQIKAGDKIAQMIPMPVLTGAAIEEREELPVSTRGESGFGSSGR